MNQEKTLSNIANLLREKRRFLLLTHKDPDADGIGSMLAMAKALQNAEKEVVLFTERPVHAPVNLLKGSEKIIQDFDPKNGEIDVTIALDCGDKDRVGGRAEHLERCRVLINIDHHEVHDLFGDLNLVDPKSSSTGELVYAVIKAAGLPIDPDVAENILAAIQTDTGSFRYENTTSKSFRIAAELMEHGASPRRISLKMTDGYSLPRIKLLELALGAVEFYNEGRIGMVTLSADMFERSQAQPEDSDKFVDYLRSVSGVEMAVLVRETGKDCYKFSMRSNSKVNVAKLAYLFGGGGHAKAAGFERQQSIGVLKKDFLKEAGKLLG
jgi:phosphoesterase RecJ-like protein